MTDSTKSWREFLYQLSKHYPVHKLGWKTAAGYELLQVDFSEWKLRFSTITPIIWVDAETAKLSSQELFESLQDVVREKGWRHRECIVLLDGEGKGLKDITNNQYFPRFVVIDADDQHNILVARSFTSALLDLICDQISIADLAPYEMSKPVTGNRFFGRESEINRIFKKSDTNFAVIGPRRIGKTSFLREVMRQLKKQTSQEPTVSEGPYVFLDCCLIRTPYDFSMALADKLQPSETTRLERQPPAVFLMGFLDRMYKTFKNPITICLDEVDRWFAPKTRDQLLLDMFKTSYESEDCRYIIAGFTPLLKESLREDSSFFKRIPESIELGPFKKRDVANMVLKPMKHLRIQFQQEGEVVERIFKETGGIPLLTQYYCMSLINQVDTVENRCITPDSLSGLQQQRQFKNLVLGSIRDAVDPKERCLVYALLTTIQEDQDAEPFALQDISNALEQNGLFINPEEIDQICERLILAGILGEAEEDNQYRFSIPIFPRVLRGRGLDYLLSEAKKEMKQ